VLLGVGIRDLTGGFKCFRRAVLEAIDLDAVTSTGYAFQIEMTYRAMRRGFRVAEIPITFADREAGASKMSKAIFLEAVWKVPVLRARALTGRL
jgi:dolichol-phosphate mannosyltransferase